MTQLIVSIDNPSLVDDILNAIKKIKGVVGVKSNKEPNTTTLQAIEDALNGDVIHCKSFEEYKKLVADIDDV